MATMTMTQQSIDTRLNWSLPPSEGGCDDLPVDLSTINEIKWDNRPTSITDVRGFEQDFELNKQGFEFHKSPTSFTQFEDEDAVRDGYYREVEQLAKKVTGAYRAHAVSHIKRVTRSEGPPKGAPPASNIHVDYSYGPRGAWQRYETFSTRNGITDDDWSKLTKKHWAILSIWRPLRTVTRDALACADKRTVDDADLTPAMLHHPGGLSHEIFNLKYDPGQKFYYQSKMQPDEVIVLKLFDSSERVGARCTPHTAFRSGEDHGLARSSIETRCMVFFEDD